MSDLPGSFRGRAVETDPHKFYQTERIALASGEQRTLTYDAVPDQILIRPAGGTIFTEGLLVRVVGGRGGAAEELIGTGPMVVPGVSKHIELYNGDTVARTVLVTAQRGYLPLSIVMPATQATDMETLAIGATIGGAGWALGDGTIQAYYMRVGTWVYVSLIFTFGSTSVAGAGGLTFTLDADVKPPLQPSIGVCRTFDASLSVYYPGIVNIGTVGAQARLSPMVSQGVAVASPINAMFLTNSGTRPMVWAAGDTVIINADWPEA